MSFTDQISSLIRAKIPLVWVVTHEEARVVDELWGVARKHKRQLWTWSAFQGHVLYDPEKINSVQRAPSDGGVKQMAKSQVPTIALNCIGEYEALYSVRQRERGGSIWVLKDFHGYLSQSIPRALRDMKRALMAQKKTIVIVSPFLAHGPSGTIPGMEPTLEKEIMVLHYKLPTRDHIKSTLKEMLSFQKQRTEKSSLQLDYSPEELDSFTSALSGLTDQELSTAISLCFRDLSKLDTEHLLSQKRQIIERSEILEYIDNIPSLDDVGGLDLAKKYFQMYSKQFTSEAKQFGVEPLRGCILTGIPGTGKTLISKAIAAHWKIPILRLDIGRVMGSLVGMSEARMREVIDQTVAISPVILQIDEIEKGLSGTQSSGQSDGGTLSRVFGTLLTAMEEKMSGVVVIATANDITALPPELIRRFNEVMFVDLPTPEEREEILNIHLRKRGRDVKKLKIDVNKIIEATVDFTGSEIEKVVQEAIVRSFHAGKKNIDTQEILGAIKDTRCIAKVMSEKIEALRGWAKHRARYASSGAEVAAGLRGTDTSDPIALSLQD